MNAFKFFKHGRSYRKNARFGTRIFIGAERFEYFMEGRPYYFYSDRPYTLSDAKAWKLRNLIGSLVLAVVFISMIFERPVNFPELVNILFNIGFICVGAFCVIRTIIFLFINPEKDPMLQATRCSDNRP